MTRFLALTGERALITAATMGAATLAMASSRLATSRAV